MSMILPPTAMVVTVRVSALRMLSEATILAAMCSGVSVELDNAQAEISKSNAVCDTVRPGSKNLAK